MAKHKYYLNKKPLLNGSFSVHKEGCPFIAENGRKIYVGMFDSCHDAIKTAQVICLPSDGCYFCNKGHSQINVQKQLGVRVQSYPICFFSEN